MMMHALCNHKDESQWVAFLDVDEFLVLPKLDNIREYLRRCPADWHSISFNWSLFGNNGYADRPPGAVLRNYTRRAEHLDHNTKTVARSAKIDLSQITQKTWVWHSWDGLFDQNFVAVNVLGDPISQVAATDGGIAYLKAADVQNNIRKTAVVNHYAFKSLRDFDLRIKRGLRGEFDGQIKWRQLADAERVPEMLQELNATEDTYLSDYWSRYLGDCCSKCIVPVPRFPNIALGKKADQSSISEFSRGATTQGDAVGLLSGVMTGAGQCHTRFELQPWWSIDLGTSHLVYEARIFKRVDQPELRDRLGAFQVEIAPQTGEWTTIHSNHGTPVIAGADGHQLILNFVPPVEVTRLRIVASGQTFLHLDQVELYGVPSNASPEQSGAGESGGLDHSEISA